MRGDSDGRGIATGDFLAQRWSAESANGMRRGAIIFEHSGNHFLMRCREPSSRPLVAVTMSACAGMSGRMLLEKFPAVLRGHHAHHNLRPRECLERLVVAVTDAGIWRPGRKSSLTPLLAIDSQTSFSCAQSRMRCVPLHPSTMAMAVPHAPAPMTAMSLIICRPRRSPRPQRSSAQPIFRSRQQADDVNTMLEHDQQRRERHERKRRPDISVFMQ